MLAFAKREIAGPSFLSPLEFCLAAVRLTRRPPHCINSYLRSSDSKRHFLMRLGDRLGWIGEPGVKDAVVLTRVARHVGPSAQFVCDWKKVRVTEEDLIAATTLGGPLELWTSDQSEICVEKRCQP